LSKLSNLRYFDCSQCPEVTGLAYVDQPIASKVLTKVYVPFTGYDMGKVKEKIQA
jgi:hypothetical protein